ncbi:MAG TPA: 3-oxoacyl-ACP reductase [Rhodospirillaceae bacterium]|nr:3-oxoacyl-ACP reductase [Candidatus Neomarinimicrobiota bacterium]HCX14522.1 3-oxoacyl-ACP reductase [Rhodospirillaceae bacterium]
MGVLDGKIALVTGAGQGIGRGIALALAKEGALIAVTGRTKSKLDAVCREIKKAGGRAEPITCDVCKLDEVNATVETAKEIFDGLDILVNNAYEGAFGPLLSVDDAKFQLGFFAGPIATFRFMKAAYPYLKERGGGDIINLGTSAAVRWDMSNYGPYGAAKEGIRVLTRAAAAEWGSDGIRVNTIAPHANSPALSAWTKENPSEAKAFVETIPLNRIGDCEDDIGRFVVLLLRPESSYITGATIPLDGGQARFG